MITKDVNVLVVIPIWNGYERTLQCLRGIESWKFDGIRFDICVLDNASSGECPQELKDYKFKNSGKINYRYARNNVHLGLTASLTRFFHERCDDSYQFILRHDNDVELDPPAMSVMINLMRKRPDIAVSGPTLYYSALPNLLNGGAVFVNRLAFKNKIINSDGVVECDVLLGAVMIFSVEALKKLNRWFDPDLFLFSEELEICFSLKRKGYKTVLCGMATGYHDTAVSTGKMADVSCYLNHRNSALVMNRITPVAITVLRNLLLFPRVLFRCIRRGDLIPFYGFVDGNMQRPLSIEWWNHVIIHRRFLRP